MIDWRLTHLSALLCYFVGVSKYLLREPDRTTDLRHENGIRTYNQQAIMARHIMSRDIVIDEINIAEPFIRVLKEVLWYFCAIFCVISIIYFMYMCISEPLYVHFTWSNYKILYRGTATTKDRLYYILIFKKDSARQCMTILILLWFQY